MPATAGGTIDDVIGTTNGKGEVAVFERNSSGEGAGGWSRVDGAFDAPMNGGTKLGTDAIAKSSFSKRGGGGTKLDWRRLLDLPRAPDDVCEPTALATAPLGSFDAELISVSGGPKRLGGGGSRLDGTASPACTGNKSLSEIVA